MAISLVKGQKINLKKDNGQTLSNICVGLNWGAIDKKGFFGNTKKEAVDLDASCAIFDANNQLLDVVYFGQLSSKDKAVIHSGDDLTGDVDGDDNLDNEVISMKLQGMNPQADKVVFMLNSYKKQDFSTIPFAAIRIYEGTPERVDSVFAKFDIAGDAKFAGYVSMVMGKFYKKSGEWKFATIGEPTKDADLKTTVNTVTQKYL